MSCSFLLIGRRQDSGAVKKATERPQRAAPLTRGVGGGGELHSERAPSKADSAERIQDSSAADLWGQRCKLALGWGWRKNGKY